MREILFRGKMYNGEWIEGDLINTVRKEDERFRDAVMILGLEYERVDEYSAIRKHEFVRPKTVGQYTGLRDKNGKRIFEGDVVHCIARLDEANCVVIFEEGEFRLVPTKRYATYVTGCGFHALRNFEKEVVGNVHDNHELLGGA